MKNANRKLMKPNKGKKLTRTLALALLLLTGLGKAWSQTYYVFQNGNYGYLYNNDGTLATSGTGNTFQKSYLWIANSSLGSTARNIRSYIDESKYLNVDGNSGGQVSLGTSTTNRWQSRSSYLCTRSGSGSYYYLNYNNNNGTFSTSNSSGGNRYTPYVVTIDPQEASGEIDMSYSGGTSIQNVDGSVALSFSLSGTYTPGYTQYAFNNGQSRNYYEYEDGSINSSVPAAISASQFPDPSLSLSGEGAQYVSLSGNTLTYMTQAPRDMQVVVTATSTYQGVTVTASQAITIYGTSISAPVITRSGNTSTVNIMGPLGSTVSYQVIDRNTNEVIASGSFEMASHADGYNLNIMTDHVRIVATATRGGATSPQAAYDFDGLGTGLYGNMVVLNDYEDHTWTYYSGVDASVDGGNYNTNYVGKMYSPDPRNVKITYQANGGAVSIDESETEFVYYKTIEKVNNAYKYQVISNPFSKRPTGKGFGGWKLKSITGTGASIGYAVNATLPLDAELTLTLPDAGVNGTSAEIVFEATWVDATIVRNTTSGLSTTGTYETNIIVLSQDYNNTITPSVPCTIMMVEPDGSADYRNRYTFSGYITPADLHDTGKTTKIEFAHWTPGNNGINPQGRNFTIGRGMNMNGTARVLYGSNTQAPMNQVLKVESGTFSNYRGCTTKPSSHTKQIVVFGNDYDRAKNDNDKLNITGNIFGLTTSQDMDFEDISKELFHITTKSGKFYPNTTLNDAKYSNSFYLFDYSRGNNGTRTLVIEGGEFGHIAGGANAQGDDATVNMKIRMKGGKVNGVIFGGAAQYDISGSKQIVITGGTVVGWIAGGSNGGASSGTSGQNGSISGKTYVYVGGNAIVGTSSSIKTNQSMGGYVFGAGCGKNATATTGMAMDGTNVVLADNASVRYGVYGGGAYGFCGDTDGTTIETANIYVTGGTVDSQYDSEFDVPGGIYGGARQNRGGHANIYMTGGLIKGNSGSGLYGGSNVSGTMAGNVIMQINGGQVGTAEAPASVYGGGYGQNTVVSGTVNIDVKGTPVITGNLYGGSYAGKVNNKVTINVGKSGSTSSVPQINNVFGAGQGSTSQVTDAIEVNIDNGLILGSVFGGSEEGQVTNNKGVVVNMAAGTVKGSVYGGGDRGTSASYDVVNMTGGIVEGNVFAGAKGNDATEILVGGVKTLNMQGGTVYGSVYGGSESASDGNTVGTVPSSFDETEYTSFVNVSGGDIRQHVYGGGYFGRMSGSVDVNVGRTAIQKSNSDNENAKYPETLGSLNIHGSVYAGSNWGDFTGGDFGAPTTSGYSNIYIDGTDYNNGLDENGLLTGNYINIGMSIYGAGTSCEAGAEGRKIWIRNYGQKVWGKQELNDGTRDQYEVLTSATRRLYSIQRCDELIMDNSHIDFIGQGDMTKTINTIEYAIVNVDGKITGDNASTVGFKLVNGSSVITEDAIDYIASIGSFATDKDIYSNPSYSLICIGDEDMAFHIGTFDGANFGNDVSGKPKENAFRINGGYSINVRYAADNNGTVNYGALKGFFRIIAAKNQMSFAYSRIKDVETFGGSRYTGENDTDGGFLSYLPSHNNMSDSGAAGTNGHQHPYTNVIAGAKADHTDFRYWKVIATNDAQHVTETANLQATVQSGSSDQYFQAAEVTVKLTPAIPGCNDSYFKISNVDFGDNVSLLDAALYETGDKTYMYYDDSFKTTRDASQPTVAAALANMKDHANNFFGLVMKSGDCFQSPQDYLVSSTSIEHIKAIEFETNSNPNGELPTMKFLLTYSNNISLNQVLSPVTITFEQYDCSGNVVATIDVPLTITTSTVLGQDITVQTYAMFGGALGTGNVDETYTVKVTMPTFTQTTNIGNVVFSVGDATFTPVDKGDYTTSAVSVPDEKDHDLNYAMEVRRGLNFDNKNGWIESGEGDFMDYVNLDDEGQYVNLGSADGRKTFTIDFKLHYNSTNPEEGYMDQGRVGTFTFKVKYNLNGRDEDFSISVEVIKRTQLKRFYIDGVNGDNINTGTFPDLAKRTLQSIYDAGYVPGDQIIVVKPVTHSGNYNLVWTNASFGDKLVTLYRYSGGHALGVTTNTDPGQNTGALLIVSSDMDVNGIVFDGLENLNGVNDNNLNPGGVPIQPMASLIQVVKGSDDAEEGGTLILEGGSQLINNHNFDNAGSNGNYGGGVYVDGFSSITLRDGTVIKDNTVIYGNGSANNGGGIYADGKVYVSGKVMVTGNKLGGWDDNVYLKDANDYITIEETIGLDLTSVIGVTKDAFPTTGNVDFTPIAYSAYPEQIEEAYNKKSVFVDDQGIYFQYYSNTEDGFDPHTLYFGKTWAAVVREEPENFDPDNIDSNEDLAWIISLVNGLNHQSVATDQDYTVKSDLNMNEHIWLPIGNKKNSFKGEFNGEGHAIDGIRIQYLNDLEAAGMFGFTEGTINNVFVTSGLIEPYAVSETTENFIGGLAGVISAGVINGSEAAVTLNANSDNVVIGGLAGLIEGGEVHSSMSMPTMNGYEMGGLAGRIKPGAFLKNSFANVDMSLASDAQGTIYTGGLVAYNEGETDNCYVRLGNVVPGSSIFGMFAGFNGGNVYNCYSPVGASHAYVGAANSGANLQYYGTYSATETPYLYKHGDNNIATVDSPSTYYTNAKDDTKNDDQYKDWPIMLRTLNQWVKYHEGYEPWMRTSADGINNDYPIHKFDGFVSVASADGRILEYKKDFGEMIGKYNKLEDGGTIDLYANADLTESGDNAINGEKVTVYINEDVALLQPDDKNLKNVYVGITLDNSAGANGANSNHPNYEGSDEIDWHMFSTSLKQAPLGINYYELNSETTDNVQHEFSFGHPASMPYYRFAVENDDHNDGYFPSHVYGTKYADGKNSEINNVDYYEDWDFYCFHEPAHHWINFKRNSNSHYDEDPATGHASITYSNENDLIQGKGYLLALKETAFLQCNGELNNGVVTYRGLTNTSNPYTQGYNLIGNPYQSYLDFDKLAEQNKYGEENSKYIFDTYYILDEDARGYVAYTKGATTVNYLPTSDGDIPEGYAAPGKLINMHQGFFVYVPEDVPEDKQYVEFDNKMRSITKDESVAFRGERPSYPIVNLAVVEGNGNCEYLTVETNRPELGGAKKMKGLRAGNSQIFAHAGDEDYSILFATEDMNEVPVRFNTVEDGVYTMIWNTHNAEYSELKLIDNIAGVTVDMLSASEYKFTANASDYASRFRLVFASAGDENDSDESEDVDFAFFDGSNLVVNGTGILSVCDVEGRVLYYTKLNDAQNSVAMPDMARGLYLLYLTNNESAKVQKIVIRK